MTIDELWSKCIPGVKNKSAISFEMLRGKRLAVDISLILHQLCSRGANALMLTCTPSYFPSDIIDTLSSWHDALCKYNIKPIYVFDGYKHLMKEKTNEDRRKVKLDATTKLNQFYEYGKQDNTVITEEKLLEAMRNVKIISYPDNKIIHKVQGWMKMKGIFYICAPFEAEW